MTKVTKAWVIEKRLVDDPMMSDAEYRYRKSKHPDNPNVGKVEMEVSMRELIGGFCRYTKRTEAQTMAAARFKGLHERCQVGGARATDYEREYVDSSFTPVSVIQERGEDARNRYADAVRAIGLRASVLIEKVIIYDTSTRNLAVFLGLNPGGAGRLKATDEVYASMDDLAKHFGY